jgi:hypothetical protein
VAAHGDAPTATNKQRTYRATRDCSGRRGPVLPGHVPISPRQRVPGEDRAAAAALPAPPGQEEAIAA